MGYVVDCAPSFMVLLEVDEGLPSMQVFHTVYSERKPYINDTMAYHMGQLEKIVFSADGSVSSLPADLN